MHNGFTVELDRIIKEFSLEELNMTAGRENRMIYSAEINRPGLQMAG